MPPPAPSGATPGPAPKPSPATSPPLTPPPGAARQLGNQQRPGRLIVAFALEATGRPLCGQGEPPSPAADQPARCRMPVRGRLLGGSPGGHAGRRRPGGGAVHPSGQARRRHSTRVAGGSVAVRRRQRHRAAQDRQVRPGRAVLLRVDTGAGISGAVGDQGKFGIQSGQAAGLARLARSLGLDPYGLAFHVGSQTMDPGAWDRPIGQCADAMAALDTCGIRLAMLDIRGGFLVRYDTDRRRWPATPPRSPRRPPGCPTRSRWPASPGGRSPPRPAP
jgi:hypothetical protein